MNPLDYAATTDYVNANIVGFHNSRLQSLKGLSLGMLLRKKNPYMFRAKNIATASELINGLLSAFLSSSEEKHFGDFLEGLAVFIAGQTCGGFKSGIQGADLEFLDDGIHYVVSIKSGPNWGNSSQQKKLAQDLREASIRIRQGRIGYRVQPVLGICYGKTRTKHMAHGYLKVVGQNFWYLLSRNADLYTDIIEPIGYRAKEHNEAYDQALTGIINRFTGEFVSQFCDDSGAIEWRRLVEFNSGNLDLDQAL